MSKGINSPNDWTDAEIEGEIQRVQEEIKSWLVARELWYDTGFKSQLQQDGCEPEGDEPVVMYLHSENALDHIVYGELEGEFSRLLERLGYWYEHDGILTLAIRANDSGLAARYYDYFHWKWVCSLLVEDTGDVYEDLYEHFLKFPRDLYKLGWREFEILLSRIFQSHGYEAILGPGRGDGGIDIRLWQKGPLGDVLTVVQAKRYAPGRKIDLTPVQALYGAGRANNAGRAIFVTTSAYTPAAHAFSARVSRELELKDSEDIISWCSKAANGVIADKSTLVSYESLKRLIAELYHRPDARVVHGTWGFDMTHNSYALVIRETKHAALLLDLGNKKVSSDSYEQCGLEVPLLDSSAMSRFNALGIKRVKREVSKAGRVTYWDGSRLYSAWSREPNYFNYMD